MIGARLQMPRIPDALAVAASAAVLAGLFLAAVLWNREHVLVPRPDGGVLVVLTDGDCHSRMQRAALVVAQPGSLVRAHDFENHPHGTVPHTTAPMDYLIAGLAAGLPSLDLAGAWISPLLGLLAVIFVWGWARSLNLRPRGPMLLLFCLSPALTHAFALGRPDHQSLLLLLTVAAITSRWAFIRTENPAWAWTSGTAWGLSLWVSWFEPAILLAVNELAAAIVLRRRAWSAPWGHAALLAAGIALTAWAVEGFRSPWPAAGVREFFPRWAAMLGELQPAPPRAMFAWTGWLLAVAPLLMVWNYLRKREPLVLIALLLLAAVTALTGWQARWSPWLAAVFALSLPWVLAPLARGWLVWTVFIISLWPVAAAWEARTMPPEAEQARRLESVREAVLIEEVGEFLATQPRGGVLAPWWISPALARLSGQPMVAGTSHQSLPGIADTARFFLAGDEAGAAGILHAREVSYVVADAPERVVPTAAALLGTTVPQHPLAVALARGRDVPPFLQPVFANDFFRVYKVIHE